ncbi:hypothetical protein MSAN_00837500 [Mycena sanguinolenta]|uniref:Cytochrome P450 n=1 Tax=Mycena sanguinolenta TaxID=230812 RepID=A0A8H7DDN6_9AGAR|nr:hypothetical protein MSAN_00837500 [Mycena sanguinolenta]
MDDLRFLLLYGVLAGVVFASFRKAVYDRKVANVPIVGSSRFLPSCWDGFRFIRHAPEVIQRGYDLYPEGIFRVARLFRWEYVVCGPKLIKDIAGAPEHAVSFAEGVEETVQAKFTMGRELAENNYHLDLVRTSLTRNLHNCFPDVRDEIICAFDDVLQLQGSGAEQLYSALTIQHEFLRMEVSPSSAHNEGNSGARQIFAPLISNKNKSNAKAMEILGPLLEERLAKEAELGPDWPGRPVKLLDINDFISWMLNVADEDQKAVLPLTLRILSINMAAIHTSSAAFTQALFDLTTHPEYLLPMREEAWHINGTVTRAGNCRKVEPLGTTNLYATHANLDV